MRAGRRALAAAFFFFVLAVAGASAKADPRSAGQAPYSDRTFLAAMITLDQNGLRMAQSALPVLEAQKVRDWAQKIIVDQQQEIKKMEGLLKLPGGAEQGAPSAGAGEAGQDAPSADAWPPDGSDADRVFMAAMLLNHRDALDMSADALLFSGNPRILELAREIVARQAGDMRKWRQWLTAKEDKG